MRGKTKPKKVKPGFLIRCIFTVLFVAGLYTPLSALSIEDALGRQVSFERPPERIVLAGRGLLMVADALYLFPEAPNRIIAIEEITLGKGNFLSVVDPHYESKTVLPVDVGAESIASLTPDLVILKSYMKRKLGESLEILDIPVVYLDFETPAQFERDIRVLGHLLGNEHRSEEIIAYYRVRRDMVLQRVAQVDEQGRPRVLFIYYSERGGSRSFNVPPAGWMQTILVEEAGGIPVWTVMQPGQAWSRVSFEQIAAWDADHVFVTSYFVDVEEVKRRLLQEPLWTSLRAVQQGNLHAVPADFYNWDLPDPRWVLGLIWYSTRLLPRLFDDVDMYTEAQTFFRELYFIEDDVYNRYVQPMLNGDLP